MKMPKRQVKWNTGNEKFNVQWASLHHVNDAQLSDFSIIFAP